MHFKYLLCIILLWNVALTYLVDGFKLNKDSSEVQPKLFKILEKGNKIELESVEETDLDPRDLVDFLQKNADIEYNKNQIDKNKSVPYNGMKREFVKRKVPHNYATPDLEYDDKLKTYFRPLARFHKTKILGDANGDTSDVFEFKKVSEEDFEENNKIKYRDQKQRSPIKQSNKVVEDEVVTDLLKQLGLKISNSEQRNNGLRIENALMKLDEMNSLAKFAGIPIEGNENLMFGASLILKHTYELYKDLYKIVEELYISQDQLKTMLKKTSVDLNTEDLNDVELTAKLLTNINRLYLFVKEPPIKREVSRIVDEISTNIVVLHRKLRSSIKSYLIKRVGGQEQSQEDQYITKDGQIAFDEHSPEQTPSPVEFPKQHLWNYWTYPTGIVDASCPPGAVKVGNVCTRLPPH